MSRIVVELDTAHYWKVSGWIGVVWYEKLAFQSSATDVFCPLEYSTAVVKLKSAYGFKFWVFYIANNTDNSTTFSP